MSAVIFLVLIQFYPALDADRMRWLFNGLVNGLLSLVTIILTINQLILSRQFGSPRDLYGRLEKRIDFKTQVEDETDAVITPSQPGFFMNHLFQSLRGSATELGTISHRRDHDERLGELLDEYVETIFGQTDRIIDTLQSEPFEMRGLLEILSYDDSWQFYTTRRMQTVYEEELSDREAELLTEIRETLKQIDTGRQYFKTLYLQRELSGLSRQVVYVGVPLHSHGQPHDHGVPQQLGRPARLRLARRAPERRLRSHDASCRGTVLLRPPVGDRHPANRRLRPVHSTGGAEDRQRLERLIRRRHEGRPASVQPATDANG
jgi:hypothetical protein